MIKIISILILTILVSFSFSCQKISNLSGIGDEVLVYIPYAQVGYDTSTSSLSSAKYSHIGSAEFPLVSQLPIFTGFKTNPELINNGQVFIIGKIFGTNLNLSITKTNEIVYFKYYLAKPEETYAMMNMDMPSGRWHYSQSYSNLSYIGFVDLSGYYSNGNMNGSGQSYAIQLSPIMMTTAFYQYSVIKTNVFYALSMSNINLTSSTNLNANSFDSLFLSRHESKSEDIFTIILINPGAGEIVKSNYYSEQNDDLNLNNATNESYFLRTKFNMKARWVSNHLLEMNTIAALQYSYSNMEWTSFYTETNTGFRN